MANVFGCSKWSCDDIQTLTFFCWICTFSQSYCSSCCLSTRSDVVLLGISNKICWNAGAVQKPMYQNRLYIQLDCCFISSYMQQLVQAAKTTTTNGVCIPVGVWLNLGANQMKQFDFALKTYVFFLLCRLGLLVFIFTFVWFSLFSSFFFFFYLFLLKFLWINGINIYIYVWCFGLVIYDEFQLFFVMYSKCHASSKRLQKLLHPHTSYLP